MINVNIIILNWNGWKMTLECLESLKNIKTDGMRVEVVVVDNGSTDESVERIEQYAKSNMQHEIIIIKNKVNLGFAEGNNVGISYALKEGADFVCLLNNDTRVSQDFLFNLVKTFESDSQIGIAGGKIYFEKGYEFHKDSYEKKDLGNVLWYAGGKIDWENVIASHIGVDEVDNGQFNETKETEYVNGCLMMVNREVFEKIGYFDKKYYLYYEENDFNQRAKEAGYKLIYNPKSFIWHINSGSSAAGSGLHDYFLTRNRMIFGMRWAHFRAKLALFKESVDILLNGRPWQKIAVRDFYFGRFGKGSWNSN